MSPQDRPEQTAFREYRHALRRGQWENVQGWLEAARHGSGNCSLWSQRAAILCHHAQRDFGGKTSRTDLADLGALWEQAPVVDQCDRETLAQRAELALSRVRAASSLGELTHAETLLQTFTAWMQEASERNSTAERNNTAERSALRLAWARYLWQRQEPRFAQEQLESFAADPAPHIETQIEALGDLGELLLTQNKLHQAEQTLLDVEHLLDDSKSTLDQTQALVSLATNKHRQGLLALARDDLTQAAHHFSQAQTLLLSNEAGGDVDGLDKAQQVNDDWAIFLTSQNRVSEAIAVRQAHLSHLGAVDGNEAWSLFAIHTALGIDFTRINAGESGQTHLLAALALSEMYLPNTDPRRALALTNCAACTLQTAHLQGPVVDWLHLALDIVIDNHGESSAEVAHVSTLLGTAYLQEERWEMAGQLFELSLAIARHQTEPLPDTGDEAGAEDTNHNGDEVDALTPALGLFSCALGAQDRDQALAAQQMASALGARDSDSPWRAQYDLLSQRLSALK